MAHKGHYSRGYLPHRDYPGALQGITFRLADSIPTRTIARWRNELNELLESPDPAVSEDGRERLRRRISRFEDSRHGACLLKQTEAAEIVQAALISGHPSGYRLLDWCVMPNHVHVLIKQLVDHPLSKIVQAWKGGTARRINEALDRGGTLWAPDFYDRFIRDEEHLARARRYIRLNPVKACLCREPEDWPFSSAGAGWDPGPPPGT